MKMKKSFSRATGLFLVLTLIFSLCSLQTSAATYWNPISGTDKWVAMPGNEVNGSPKPSNISLGRFNNRIHRRRICSRRQ